MKKLFIRTLSVILTVVLLTQIAPLSGISVSAASARSNTVSVNSLKLKDVDSPDLPEEQLEQATPLSEDISLRSIDTKHFCNADGTFSAMVYPQPVHYQDTNGNWQEIDNTLLDKGDHISPKASGVAISLPKELAADKKITLASGGTSLSIGVVTPAPLPRPEPETTTVVQTTEATTERAEEISTEAATEATLETYLKANENLEESETEAEQTAAAETTTVVETTTEMPAETTTPFVGPNPQEAVPQEASQAIPIDMHEDGPKDIATVENLNSGLVYLNAFPGADLEYVLTPNKLKESVIVREKQDKYEYQFTLDMENLTAAPQEDGSIQFLDAKTEQLKFKIEAPVAIDSAEEVSYDALSIQLDGNILTLTADSKWMNDKDRAFPVVLDPTYVYPITSAILSSACITKNWGVLHPYELRTMFSVGKGSKNGDLSRSLMQFPLPTLPSNSIITNAQLILDAAKGKKGNGNDPSMKIGVYEITHTWSDNNVTWSNQPSTDDVAIGVGEQYDSNKYGENDVLKDSFLFDITTVAKKWYETGDDNYGFQLRSMDENKVQKMQFAALSLELRKYPLIRIENEGGVFELSIPININPGANNPMFQIQYINNVGLEDYWTYETINLGVSGAAFVNHYNGGLTYTYQDVEMKGERMPFVLAHTYVSAHENFNGQAAGMKFGIGFRLNLIEEIAPVPVYDPDSPDPEHPNVLYYEYRLIDGDGTVHYYMRENGRYFDELNPTFELIPSGGSITIQDDVGNKKTYNTYNPAGEDRYYLAEIFDHNNNNVSIHYNSAGQIDTITDTTRTRIIKLDYDNGYLSKITDPAGNAIEYTYDTDKNILTQIKYTDQLKQDFPDTTLLKYNIYQEYDPDDVLRTHLSVVQSADLYLHAFDYGRTGSYERPTYRVIETKQGTADIKETTKVIGGEKPTKGIWFKDHPVLARIFYILSYSIFTIADFFHLLPEDMRIDDIGYWYRENQRKKELYGDGEVQNLDWKNTVEDETFDYHLSETQVTDKISGNETIYLFDRAGRTVGAVDQYSGTESTSYTAGNKPQYSANAPIVRNLLQNPSFEYDDSKTWSGGGQATEAALFGSRAWLLSSGEKQSQKVTLPAGTYTLSVFAKGDQGQLSFVFGADSFDYETAYSEQWNRFSTTFTLTKETSGAVALRTLGEFTEFDGVQLEQSGGANLYNYVEDSHFDFQSPLWTLDGKTGSDGLKYERTDKNDQYYEIQGDPNAKKALAQKVLLNAREGMLVAFGARASANAVSTGQFMVVAKFYDDEDKSLEYEPGTSTEKSYPVSFNSDIRPIKGPGNSVAAQAKYAQSAMTSVVLPADCAYMKLFICYNDQAPGEYNSMKVYDSFVYLGAGGTVYEYDENGKIKSSKTDAGTVTYDYVPGTSEVKSVTSQRYDGLAQTVAVTYENHNIKTVTKGGVVSTYTYAAGGVVTSVKTTENSSTSERKVTYDNNNNTVASITDESGAVATYKHDANGNITESNGLDGAELTYGFQSKNLLSNVNGKAGGLLSPKTQNDYIYNTRGQLTQTKHEGTLYNFSYDDAGNLNNASIGEPGTAENVITNTYNNKNQLAKTLFADGELGGYEPTFDNQSRLVSEAFSEPGSNVFKMGTKYIYSDSGALTQVQNMETGRTNQFSYDMDGQVTDIVTTKTDSTDVLARTQTEYNSVGLLGHLKATADGIRLTDNYYSYDDQLRPYEIELSMLDNAKLSYEYTTLNRPLSKTLALPSDQQAVTSYSYLQRTEGAQTLESNYISELQNHVGGKEIDYQYTYDKANIETVSEKDAHGVWQKTQEYSYDNLGQLTGDGTYTYEYDGSNLKKIKTGPLSTEREFIYSTGAWKDQLVGIKQDGETKAITYDAFGNLSTFDGQTYIWKKGGQLAGINGNGLAASYEYDYTGLRSKKMVNGVETKYVWAGNLLLGELSDEYNIAWSYDTSGRMIGFTLNGYAYFYIRNLQSDVVGIHDAEGNVIVRYTYDPWGKIVEIQDDSGENIGNINPIRYRGYYYDNETDLYYCQTRYYNPEWCRWISADIYFDTGAGVQGANMYAYCNNNPVMNYDPTGTIISELISLLTSPAFWQAIKVAFEGFVLFMQYSAHAIRFGFKLVKALAEVTKVLVEQVVVPTLSAKMEFWEDFKSKLPAPANKELRYLHAIAGTATDVIMVAGYVTAFVYVACVVAIPICEALIPFAQARVDFWNMIADTLGVNVLGWISDIVQFVSIFMEIEESDVSETGLQTVSAQLQESANLAAAQPQAASVPIVVIRPNKTKYVDVFVGKKKRLEVRFYSNTKDSDNYSFDDWKAGIKWSVSPDDETKLTVRDRVGMHTTLTGIQQYSSTDVIAKATNSKTKKEMTAPAKVIVLTELTSKFNVATTRSTYMYKANNKNVDIANGSALKVGSLLRVYAEIGDYYYVSCDDNKDGKYDKSDRWGYVLKSDTTKETQIVFAKTAKAIAVTDSFNVDATVISPILTDKSVAFTSSDATIASVGVSNGKVEGKKVGITSITGTTKDGKTATCKVVVGWYAEDRTWWYHTAGEKTLMDHNASFIYTYFREKGWSKEALWAVLGNMQAESGINPGKWETTSSPRKGFGLVQWTNPPDTNYLTANPYRNWANEKGYAYDSMIGQLERILYEVEHEHLQWNETNPSRMRAAQRNNVPLMTFKKFTTSELDTGILAKAWCILYEYPGDIDNTAQARAVNAVAWKNICTW